MSSYGEDPEEIDEYFRNINRSAHSVRAEFYSVPPSAPVLPRGKEAATIRELDALLDEPGLFEDGSQDVVRETELAPSPPIVPQLEKLKAVVSKARPKYGSYARRIYLSIAPPGETKAEAKKREKAERERQDRDAKRGGPPRRYRKDRRGMSPVEKDRHDQQLDTVRKAAKRDAERQQRDQQLAADMAEAMVILEEID